MGGREDGRRVKDWRFRRVQGSGDGNDLETRWLVLTSSTMALSLIGRPSRYGTSTEIHDQLRQITIEA